MSERKRKGRKQDIGGIFSGKTKPKSRKKKKKKQVHQRDLILTKVRRSVFHDDGQAKVGDFHGRILFARCQQQVFRLHGKGGMKDGREGE